MYQDKVSIPIPERSRNAIANITLTRVNDMLMWRQREQLGDSSLASVLWRCYEQRNGILSCEDREAAEAIGVNAYVNLTDLKCSAIDAWMLNILGEASELPFVVDPTPIPSLSKNGVEEALQRVKQALYVEQYSGSYLELVREVKNKVLKAEQDTARDAADRMYKLMYDQMIEGKFHNALSLMIRDFTTFPFCAMHGPVVTSAPRLTWTGNSLKPKDTTFYAFRSLSPFDLFWSPDSPDTQRGTGIAIIERWSRQTLLQCAALPSYNQKELERALADCDDNTLNLLWVSGNPDRPQEMDRGAWRDSGATVEVIRHYGFFSGRELNSAGVTGVDGGQYYNTCVTMIGPYVIQVFIDPNPNAFARPVFAATYGKTGDKIAGISIAQKLRDVERCYMATLRYLMRNAAQASEPITEADYKRLVKYMAPDDIARLSPGMTFLADSSAPGNNGRAVNFHTVPSNMGAYQAVLQFFSDLSDRITQAPAALHGEPVGTGANRTFRGMSMLYGNAMKPLQMAIANLDNGIFGPSAELLYNYNMVYSKDASIKGDALIRARGATGLMERETRKQTAMETLQLVAQVGAAAAEQMPPGLLPWAFNEVLKPSDVPKELLFPEGGGQPAQIAGGSTPPPMTQPGEVEA